MLAHVLIAVASIATAHNGRPVVVDDTAMVVEVNHVYCESTGEPTLSQVIWWDWDGGRFVVVDWRMARDVKLGPLESPSGGYRCQFRDTDGTLRRVHSRMRRVVYSTNDREIDDRALLPSDQRRKLSRPDRSQRDGT